MEDRRWPVIFGPGTPPRRLSGLAWNLLFVLILIAAPRSSWAAGPALELSQRALARGDYATAIARLEAIEKPAAQARLLLAAAYLAVGRYGDVRSVTEPLGARKAYRSRAAVLAARADLAVGHYAAAKRRLKKAIKRDRAALEPRVLLAEARLLTGASFEDLPAADWVVSQYESEEFEDGPRLTQVARALYLMRYARDANAVFVEATAADPTDVRPELYWAQLFLDKEDEENASRSLDKVLAKNPNHPLALTLTAFVDSSSDNDTVKALKRLERALKVNPHFVPALLMKADVLIGTEQFAAAQAVVASALAQNARSPRALMMMAVCRLLQEDGRGFGVWMKKALAVNPRYAEGWHRVAEYTERQHRYRDAIAFEKKAIALDKAYWPAYVGLGIGYSRVGNDKKADALLQEAFANDPFNVRAFNMTDGFYDHAAKRMVWKSVGRFKLRMEASEAPLLMTLLPAFLREAVAAHTAHYHFKPRLPLHLELFKDRLTFAVRSVAYPGMGAHGYCFGHVVTAVSPSNGDFNWAMVLWHELAHVWHIQMSHSRVPRWFTEGLAEFETTLRRPEWKREMDSELWAFFKAGKLKGIEHFNTMFTGAQSLNEIVLAYYYATRVVGFIHQKYGFDVFPKMLRAWGARKDTRTVFREVLKVELEDFDREAKAWLASKALAAFSKAYDPGPADGPDQSEVAKAYRAGAAAVGRGAWAAAVALLQPVLDAKKDGFRLRELLAQAAIGLEDWDGARTQLRRALALNPQDATAYKRLRRVLEKLDDQDGLYALMKQAADLDEQGIGLVLDILEKARTRGAKADLREFVTRAKQIAPFLPQVWAYEAEAKRVMGAAQQALAILDKARDLPGAGKVGLLNLIRARVLLDLGDKTKARSVLEGLGSDEAKALLQGL